jgi:hypothetical protein
MMQVGLFKMLLSFVQHTNEQHEHHTAQFMSKVCLQTINLS